MIIWNTMEKEILLLLISFFCSCLAQNNGFILTSNPSEGQCNFGSSCISLTRCPALLRKAVSRNVAFRREVQAAACKLVNNRMYVCCPSVKPDVVTTAPVPTRSREDLLPKNCGQPTTDDRIFGGDNATLGAYPWMVAFGYRDTFSKDLDYICAGTIISSRYVLTAAHCLHESDIPGLELAALNLGEWDLANPGIDIQDTRLGVRRAASPSIVAGFEEIIIHENYNKRFETSDDIALIRLDRELVFKGNKLIQPICLPPANFEPSSVPDGKQAIAAGWGFTEGGKKSSILLRVNIPFANEQTCADRYQNRFTPSQICAGGVKGRDTCGGDSGGPLILSGERGPPLQQIGIISFGPRICAQEDFPAVYTNVAKYRKWIVNHLKP